MFNQNNRTQAGEPEAASHNEQSTAPLSIQVPAQVSQEAAPMPIPQAVTVDTAQVGTEIEAQDAAAPIQSAEQVETVSEAQEPQVMSQDAAAEDAAEDDELSQVPQFVEEAMAREVSEANETVPSNAWDYFHGKHHTREAMRYNQYANRKTGFAGLDAVQTFYPGLYGLGAIPSIGKSTWANQLADQLSAQGIDVFQFILEQSRREMFNKSVTRYASIEDLRTRGASAYTNEQVAKCLAHGQYPQAIADAIDAYTKDVGRHANVITSDEPFDVDTITEIVEAYKLLTGRVPVVIIDYLQIMQPVQVNGRYLDGRASIDHDVMALKRLQKRHNMTIIVISSLNRQNYTSPIDFESFKESGGIEYACDVLWGLQLSAVHTSDAVCKTAKGGRRGILQRAKAAIPRDVELVCLKNRHGTIGYTVKFKYYPNHDTFLEANGGDEDE